jgi:beta-mannosidase
MAERIDLNDGWQFTWGEVSGGDRGKGEPKRPAQWMAAAVPGDVHLDLMREGILKDPFVGDDLDHAVWVERKEWWWKRTFDTPADVAGKRAYLVFHGLDTYGTVWLNGTCLGTTDNMFMRYEFDATDVLNAEGTNELLVRLAPPWVGIEVDPDHAPVDWTGVRIFARKAQMSFGWDIAPRLLTVGISRPVELVIADTARITDVRVTHGPVPADEVEVRLDVEVEWLADAPGRAVLSGRVHDGQWRVEAELAPGTNAIRAEVTLRDPPLWWPVGYGDPELVDCEVRLESAGRELDAHRRRIGIRTLELVREPQPSGAESFRFRCNGRDMLVTGFNWTPLDAIFARVSDERYTETLESLAGIGTSMLRMWGGGIYEPPHFYDECDRLGILIWQDFMIACGWFPQNDRFAAAIDAEARQIVRDLRNRPCIALRCGDNESHAQYASHAPTDRITLDVLQAVCDELDPQRPYIPSSPYSPRGGPSNGQTDGDMHFYAHGTKYDDPAIWDIRCRFMSEFGHLSLPSVELIRKYFPPGTEWPLTSPMWRFHGTDTIYVTRFRGAERILQALEANGLPVPTCIEEAVRMSQQLQADAVCAWIEHYCEDPEFGGFLLWNVSDCWPQQSDAVTEYGGQPKAIFARLGDLFDRVRSGHAQ